MVSTVIKRAQKFSEQWGEYILQYKSDIHWRSKDKGIIVISHNSQRPMNGIDLKLSEPIDIQIKSLAQNINEFPQVNRSKKKEEEHTQQAKFISDLIMRHPVPAIQAIQSALNTSDIVFAGSEVVLYEGKGKFKTPHKQIIDCVLVSPSRKQIYLVEMKKEKPSKNKKMSPYEQLYGYLQTYKDKDFFVSLCKLISCYCGQSVSEEYSMNGIIVQGYKSESKPTIMSDEFLTFKF
ncbi:MAG: hypothetical protein IJR38_02630 [Selenomonadaceae bacterium]|nr:hypothetical protein [Selenomonadaceae bacterium]